MAINTVTRRMSVVAVASEHELVLADGTIAVGDRQTIIHLYSGIAATAVGGNATVDLTDDNTTTNMHGLIAGRQYKWWVNVYIPSGQILGTEVIFRLGAYHSGAWDWTSQAAANSYDAWQALSITKTLDVATTGVVLRVEAFTTATLEEYFYVDRLRLQPLGIRNEHEENYKDDGTDTM